MPGVSLARVARPGRRIVLIGDDQATLRVVAGAAPDVERSGSLGASEIAPGLAEVRAWSGRSDAALWYAVPLASRCGPVSRYGRGSCSACAASIASTSKSSA
jgi:hypothetical protein